MNAFRFKIFDTCSIRLFRVFTYKGPQLRFYLGPLHWETCPHGAYRSQIAETAKQPGFSGNGCSLLEKKNVNAFNCVRLKVHLSSIQQLGLRDLFQWAAANTDKPLDLPVDRYLNLPERNRTTRQWYSGVKQMCCLLKQNTKNPILLRIR